MARNGGIPVFTPLAKLKAIKTTFPPPAEFDLRYWLNSIDGVLQNAEDDWVHGEKAGDQARVERSYKGIRKSAELLQLITHHPDYPHLSTKPNEQQKFRRVRDHFTQLNKAIAPKVQQWLEDREKEYASASPGWIDKSSTPSEDAVARFIDSYSSQDGAATPPPPTPLGHPSPPLTSVASRLAALRSNGLHGTLSAPTVKPVVPPKPLSLVPPSSTTRLDPPSPNPVRMANDKTALRDEGSAPHRPLGSTEQTHSPARPELSSEYSASHFPSLSEFEQLLPDSPPTNPVPTTSHDSRRRSVSPFSPDSPPRAYRREVEAMSSTSSTSDHAAFKSHRDRPPPTQPSSDTSSLPFAAEVSPSALYSFLNSSTRCDTDGGEPRIILLDVRTREEWDRGRIQGEAVCLEPVGIRGGITSSDIEASLTALSPTIESQRFSSRANYDLVIVYDRSSLFLPTSPPPSTASDQQKVLWNLLQAIYDNEFRKSLRRQPVLLKGGWEAWVKVIGGRGVVTGEGEVEQLELRTRAEKSKSMSMSGSPYRDEPADTPSDAESENRRRNRTARVVNGGLGTVNGAAFVVGDVSQLSPLAPSSLQSSSTPPRPLRPPSPPFTTSSYQPQSPRDSLSSIDRPTFDGTSRRNGSEPGLLGHRLAMPPIAAQRGGGGGSWDYANPSSASSTLTSTLAPVSSLSTRPSYPQPHLNGRQNLPKSDDFSSQSYAGGTITYPSLTSAASVPPSLQSSSGYRSLPPTPASVRSPPPPVVARPPAAQPAPLRSNSFASQHGLMRDSHVPSSGFGEASTRSLAKIQPRSFGGQAIGLTGLKNLGNTCYMNSTVQCLSATIPFAAYFKDGSYKRDINRANKFGTQGALADAVSELIRAIWAQGYSFLSPVTFRENISRWAPQFRGNEQHDAQEFLGFLLDGLHEDLNYIVTKPKPVEMSPERENDLENLPQQVMSQREWDIYRRRDDSFVVQCFQGQFRNQMRCMTCAKTSTTYNTFMPLSIPIPSGRPLSKVALEDCIKQFVREEILDKDDMWNCPRCKVPRKATKKLTLARLPPILVIHLKRFSFKGPFSDKIETQVLFPLSGLDLTSFMPPPLPHSLSQSASKGYIYDLYGVTNHFGTLGSGHYTAFVKSHHEWNNIGDSKVQVVDPAAVESARNAYILYYALRW